MLGFDYESVLAADFSTKRFLGSRLLRVRLILVFSLSIWMAGGCLLGCGSTAMAASVEPEVENAAAAMAGHNCHTARNKAKAPKGVASFAPGPRGTMTDCPLAASATAVTTKNSGQLPNPGASPVASSPLIENRAVQLTNTSLIPIPPNRGPTYLRCCVLLI